MKTVISFFVVATLCLGVTFSAQAQWPLGKELGQSPPKPADSSSSITVTGRYQMFVSPNDKSHTFMIDTETGRLWMMNKDAVSGNLSLKRIPVEEVDSGTQDTPNKDYTEAH